MSLNPRIYPPSQNIPPLSTNLYVRPSQNLPLPPRIYPPFQSIYMCDPPRIYPSLPEYTPLFNKCIYVTLPESTSPSQKIPPFSPTICDPLRIYPSQNIPPFSTNVYVRPSQNIPLPLKISLRTDPSLPEYTPPFSTTIILCDPPRIYPSLPEYTSPPFNKCICVTLQNLPLPPRIYPLFNNSMRPSRNLLLPPRINPLSTNVYYVRPSKNIPLSP